MPELKMTKLSEIRSEPMEWLWEPYIPCGMLALETKQSGDKLLPHSDVPGGGIFLEETSRSIHMTSYCKVKYFKLKRVSNVQPVSFIA